MPLVLCSERQSKSDREHVVGIPYGRYQNSDNATHFELWSQIPTGMLTHLKVSIKTNKRTFKTNVLISVDGIFSTVLWKAIKIRSRAVVGIPYVRYQNSDNATHFEQVWSGLFNSGNEWNSLSPPFNFPKSQFPVLPRWWRLECRSQGKIDKSGNLLYKIHNREMGLLLNL